MIRLVSRVGAAIVASVVVSVFLVRLLLGPGSGELPDAITENLLAAGLAAYRDSLASVPAAERPAVVERWKARVRLETTFADNVPGQPDRPWGQVAGWSADVRLPLGDEVAVLGPLRLPVPTWTRLGAVVLGVTAIVVASASLIVWPLTARLARLEDAMRRFRGGDLAVRVVDSVDDPIGQMVTGFNHMASTVEHRVRRQEELLQAVSHEYGTPLARLAFRTELLARRLPDEHQDRIEAIRRDLAVLEQLTGELVSFVELDAPQVSLERIATPTSLVLEAVREECAGYDVVLDLRGDEANPLVGRSGDLRRCVANLARNAVRYAKGTVRVVVVDTPSNLRVCVEDDGPGVPEASLDVIFEPFARLESSRDRRTGGVGLGLPIARRCAGRLGGTLSAGRSELGGAAFTLDVPRSGSGARRVVGPPGASPTR